MTAKTVAAALSALSILGGAAHAGVLAGEHASEHAGGAPAAAVELAELVPVEPSVRYYPLPPSAAREVPAAAPPAAAGPAATGPAALEGGWEGGPVKDKDGGFSYCVVEGRFDTGHRLIVARNPKGEVNLGIAIPGAELPAREQWRVTVAVDGKFSRERNAVAPQPDMLVIPNGRDEELYGALMNGRELVVSSAADRIAFALTGTRKILADLRACVEKAGDVPPLGTGAGKGAAAGRGGGKDGGLPAGLLDLLDAAGLHKVEPVSLEKLPPEQRPADVAWRFGPILGGIRERVVAEGSTLPALSETFAEAVKARCEGTATIALNPPEELPGMVLRTGAVDCAQKDGGTLHVSMTFFLSRARLFTILFHEAGEADKELADQARDNLADVLRRIAAVPPAESGKP